MVKRLTTIFFLLALTANSLSALPPHQAGTGGCEESCCETARQSGPAATISAICCIVECPQTAEIPPVTAASSAPQPALLPAAFSTSELTSYLQQARFPSAPTRHLRGSSSRYLDCCSILI